MRFSQTQINLLYDSIRAAFVPDELEILLSVRFGVRYGAIVASSKTDDYRVFKLVEHYNAKYEIEHLVAAVRDARPSVPEFTELAEAAGLIQLPAFSVLQALARPLQGGTVGQDPGDFRRKLAVRENSLCRIVIDNRRFGTGMLIGEDIVLTNHHVIEKAIAADGESLNNVVCEFDHRETAQRVMSPVMPVQATRVLASSPFAEADQAVEPANTAPEFLDYAVIRLAKRIADQPIVESGEPRGMTRLLENSPELIVDQGLLILQHPNAMPMRLDLGSVTWRNPVRIRHSAHTLHGSSGAPIFDADLSPVALHHAGYETSAVNQAIPISLIIADARAKGISL
ncbi:trypsin-like serine peptidase [Rhizobium tropici]|uniref:trypsin-like serine peptidase n=1 Tax=Rhizobium tropici TaxID=398 RepID=UPI000DD3C70B|nr:trypsin-like peptidase domain-containing protein [Rhizobium tropici]